MSISIKKYKLVALAQEWNRYAEGAKQAKAYAIAATYQ